MGQFIVTGGQRLNGELTVEGAKNAVLPILAATVINGGINVIHNCPQLHDVDIMFDILRGLGCKLKIEGSSIQIDSSSANSSEIPEKLAIEMRSSIFLMGPMLARCKKVTISYPGGCVSSWALFILNNILRFVYEKQLHPGIINHNGFRICREMSLGIISDTEPLEVFLTGR